jgi:hypothetical protein
MALGLNATAWPHIKEPPEKIDYVNSFTTVAGFPATIV